VSKKTSKYDATIPQLDVQTQASHAVFLAKSGIRGLVLLGSTGEAVHLILRERVELLSGVRKELETQGFKDYPLIAGTASQGIAETLEQIQASKDAGAQWALCLAPGYFAATVGQDGIARWFEAVADRSSLPILVYHYPGVSNNVTLTPNTMERLARHPNIVGCKLSHGALDDHILIASNPNIDHSKFHTFTGLGQQLLPVLTIGGAGAIDGLAGFFPKSVVRLFRMFEETSHDAKGLQEMRSLQYKISRAEKLVVKWGTIGIREATSRIAGFGDPDGGRVPLQGGFPDGNLEWEKWKASVEALQLLENSL
jgi:2-keto-3-deoxy-L-rhamnonate aldolase